MRNIESIKQRILSPYLPETAHENWRDHLDILRIGLLSSFLTGQRDKVDHAAIAIYTLPDVGFTSADLFKMLAVLETLTSKGKALMDWRYRPRCAIDQIQHFLEEPKPKCKCGILTENMFYAPYTECYFGSLKEFKSSFVNHKLYREEFYLECSVCNQQWMAYEELGYHYPYFVWSRIAS